MEEEIKNKENTKNKKIKKIIEILFLILIIGITISVIVLYRENRDVQNFFDKNILKKTVNQEDLPYIETSTDTNTYICAYSKYIGVLNNNVLLAYNSYGKQEISLNINITSPIFSAKGKYLAIGENGGNKIYLILDKNILWQTDIEGKIEKIVVNKNGYVAVAVSQTSYKSIIITYSPNGKEICKTYLSSTYATDICISDDNKKLAIAETNLSGIKIVSGIRIISLENVEQNTDQAVIYKKDIGENNIITSIYYDNSNNLLCMLDNKIIKIDNTLVEKQITEYSENTLYADISLNNQIVEIINNEDEKVDVKVKVTNTTNDNKREYLINALPKELKAKENIVVVNTGSEAYFITSSGFLNKKYKSNQEIKEIVMSEYLAGIIYKNKIEIIRF